MPSNRNNFLKLSFLPIGTNCTLKSYWASISPAQSHQSTPFVYYSLKYTWTSSYNTLKQIYIIRFLFDSKDENSTTLLRICKTYPIIFKNVFCLWFKTWKKVKWQKKIPTKRSNKQYTYLLFAITAKLYQTFHCPYSKYRWYLDMLSQFITLKKHFENRIYFKSF